MTSDATKESQDQRRVGFRIYVITHLVFSTSENERLHHLLRSRNSVAREQTGVRVAADFEDGPK